MIHTVSETFISGIMTASITGVCLVIATTPLSLRWRALELKKQTESKATALESEVSMLREEVESSKTLLGYKYEVSGDPPASKPEKAEKRKSRFNILK